MPVPRVRTVGLAAALTAGLLALAACSSTPHPPLPTDSVASSRPPSPAVSSTAASMAAPAPAVASSTPASSASSTPASTRASGPASVIRSTATTHVAAPAPKPVHTPVVTAPKPTPAPAPAAVGSVTAIGDSVMVDAQPSLQAAIVGIDVDAAVSRQVQSGISDVAARASSGRLGHTVVFALGTNGTFSAGAFAQLVSLSAGRHLVVVTSHCPYCSWTPTNNAMVRSHCTAATHCTVADWDALADHNGGWFSGDGVHMGIGGTGAKAYAQLVRSAL